MNIEALKGVIESRRAELAKLIRRHGGRDKARRNGAYPTLMLVAREARMLRRCLARKSLKVGE